MGEVKDEVKSIRRWRPATMTGYPPDPDPAFVPRNPNWGDAKLSIPREPNHVVMPIDHESLSEIFAEIDRIIEAALAPRLGE